MNTDFLTKTGMMYTHRAKTIIEITNPCSSWLSTPAKFMTIKTVMSSMKANRCAKCGVSDVSMPLAES